MTAVAQAFDTTEREIIVLDTARFRAGRSTNGRGWVLDEVFATELDNAEITVPLRSFDRLDRGPVRVAITPHVKDGVLQHYTLKRVRSAEDIRASRSEARAAVMGEPAPRTEPADDARIAALEARMDALEGRFALLTSLLETN